MWDEQGWHPWFLICFRRIHGLLSLRSMRFKLQCFWLNQWFGCRWILISWFRTSSIGKNSTSQTLVLRDDYPELQFVFFDMVWTTWNPKLLRVNEINALRKNLMKCIFSEVLHQRLWITRGCYATMYLAALQAVFSQLGSLGCWAQAILRCRADLTQLLFAQMGSALLIFSAAKN